eukprot:1115362-Rhodomonas_salina.3
MPVLGTANHHMITFSLSVLGTVLFASTADRVHGEIKYEKTQSQYRHAQADRTGPEIWFEAKRRSRRCDSACMRMSVPDIA